MRSLAIAALATLLASLLAAHDAHAQLRTALDAAVGAQRAARVASPAGAPAPDWSAQPMLGGELRLDAPLASFDIGGAAGGAPRAADGAWRGGVEMSGAVATPAWRGLRAGIGVAGRIAPGGAAAGVALAAPTALRAVAPGVPYAAADAHVSLRRGTTGAWIGAEALDVRDDAGAPGAREAQGAPRTLALRLGLWRQLRRVTLSLSAGTRAGAVAMARTVPRPGIGGNGGGTDSTVGAAPVTSTPAPTVGPGIDSGATRALRHWSEVEARLGWARGRVAVDGVVGARARTAGIPAALWLQGSGAVGIAPGLALVARGGVLPNAPAAMSVGARRFAALGVRLSPAALWRPAAPPTVRPVAARFSLRRLDATRQLVTLRAPGARVVELTGDFTGWRPVAMRQVDLDTWELVAEIAPGPHRCNVRIDGEAWLPPPGATAVDDDFNGRVGLIVVQ